MPDPTDAHLLAAIKAAGLEDDFIPEGVRRFLEKHRDVRGTVSRSIHAHAVTLARVEVLEAAERALSRICTLPQHSREDAAENMRMMQDIARAALPNKDTPA